MKKITSVLLFFTLGACIAYQSPSRDDWPMILRGATFSEMTDTMKIAKRPVFLGGGGKIIKKEEAQEKKQYGEEPSPSNLNPVLVKYMALLEYELYDSLLKSGIQVQRVGTDVVLLLTRDSFMYTDAPEISNDGRNTLKTVAKILKKYDATFIEIAGYTDSMQDKNASEVLSLDMAQRVAIFMVKNDINAVRMFIVGRGPARPIAAQDDIGRRMNRRVEIKISPSR
jgi:outer membrane protein OmpA-like peptidoglycan-associated protein